MKYALIFTCEHASYQIPIEYQDVLLLEPELLTSHEGWDIGAATVFKAFCENFTAETLQGEYTRLLVDLNRSVQNPEVFSEKSALFSKQNKTYVMDRYYWPYQKSLYNKIAHWIEKSIPVLHISVHSFTPQLKQEVRGNDIGLLLDPTREKEVQFCEAWKAALLLLSPSTIIEMNYPYRGDHDGLTTIMRSHFPAELYLGIELETNQKHYTAQGLCKNSHWLALLVNSLKQVI